MHTKSRTCTKQILRTHHTTSQSSDSRVSSAPNVPTSPTARYSGAQGAERSLCTGSSPARGPAHGSGRTTDVSPRPGTRTPSAGPRRAQGSQAETQTMCGEENGFKRLKTIIYILSDLRKEKHNQEQDAMKKELSENKYSLKLKPGQK